MDGGLFGLVSNSSQEPVLRHETLGWKIENGVITYPSYLDMYTAYRFVLEAIYDGRIPVTKIIGYTFVTANIKKQSAGKDMFSRSPGGLDDKMSIIANVSKLVLMRDGIFKPSTRAQAGEVTIHNMDLTYSQEPCITFSTGEYIMSNTVETSLEMVASCDTGYRDAQYNYNQIMKVARAKTKSRYTPMPSYHNIMDFVQVVPPVNDGKLRLHYKYGMTDEYFRILFNRLFSLLNNNEWAVKFKEVIHA